MAGKMESDFLATNKPDKPLKAKGFLIIFSGAKQQKPPLRQQGSKAYN